MAWCPVDNKPLSPTMTKFYEDTSHHKGDEIKCTVLGLSCATNVVIQSWRLLKAMTEWVTPAPHTWEQVGFDRMIWHIRWCQCQWTHWGWVTHICVSILTTIGSDNGLVPSHYLNQCRDIVNWALRNKLQSNPNRNSYLFIQENAFEHVWKMAAILSPPQCVKDVKRHLTDGSDFLAEEDVRWWRPLDGGISHHVQEGGLVWLQGDENKFWNKLYFISF